MSNRPSLGNRRALGLNIFLLIIAFGLLIGVFYQLTYRFDYNWSWGEIPNYIFRIDEENVLAAFDGQIEVSATDSKFYLVNERERLALPIEPEALDVELGEVVEKDQVLGRSKVFQFGILAQGLWLTLQISLMGGLLALIMGLLAGLAKSSKLIAPYWLSTCYIELIRGTPLLVQLFIIYFMIGTVLGVDSRFWCGAVALGLFAGAYIAEIIRGGIESIPRGQMEAALSLGLSRFKAMRFVIMPQVFKRSLPALAGTLISLIKDSSLVSVMALTDLTKAGREVAGASFMVFETWITVALLYLILTMSLSFLVSRWEQRLSLGAS